MQLYGSVENYSPLVAAASERCNGGREGNGVISKSVLTLGLRTGTYISWLLFCGIKYPCWCIPEQLSQLLIPEKHLPPLALPPRNRTYIFVGNGLAW